MLSSKKSLPGYITECSAPDCKVRVSGSLALTLPSVAATNRSAADAGIPRAELIRLTDFDRRLPWRRKPRSIAPTIKKSLAAAKRTSILWNARGCFEWRLTWVRAGKAPIRAADGKIIGVRHVRASRCRSGAKRYGESLCKEEAMNRAAALLVVGIALPAAHAQAPVRPNILFIFSDDHAAHAISAYGSKINTTPNLDRLAREGMLFRLAFVTNSICAPSRATAYANRAIRSSERSADQRRAVVHSTTVTFPKLLQASGYQTTIIGKWHLKTLPEGFDHY